jgi:hypothetical protein
MDTERAEAFFPLRATTTTAADSKREQLKQERRGLADC